MHVFNQSRVAQTQGSLFRLAQLGQVDWNRLNLGPVVPKSRLKLVGWVPLVVWPLMLGLNQRPGRAEIAPVLSGGLSGGCPIRRFICGQPPLAWSYPAL